MRSRLRRDERGVAALEFAMVAPILLALVYGAISFGIVLSVKHVTTESASEGARAAIGAQITAADTAANPANPQNAAYIRVATARAVQSLGPYAANVTATNGVAVQPGQCTNAAAGNTCVTVTVTYPYGTHPIIPNAPGLSLVMPTSISSVFQVQVS